MSRSKREAEYRSLAHLVADIWISSLLVELKFSLSKPPIVWCDNLSTMMLSTNPTKHARTKHVELELYFVREKVHNGSLIVKHIRSIDQIADILTKSISSSKFYTLRRKLKVDLIPTLSLRGTVKEALI